MRVAKRVAITIAGAVSLGSYEAGVIYELLESFRQHNVWVTNNGRPGERIEVDVLTGASAGGMTAAMTALALLFDGASLADPYNNPMYNAWVKEIDIEMLLNRGPKEDATCSILSSDCVLGISKKHLTPPAAPAGPPHDSLASSGLLQLGIAISNLNGIDYERSTMTGGKFVYTKHQDQRLFTVDRSTGYDASAWESIRETAVACGAFPVAFRTQEIARNISDFVGDRHLRREPWAEQQTMNFCYTDGGVFYNEPLGMAMNLVQDSPDGRFQGTARGYLFIAPRPKSSDMLAGIRADNANFKMLATSLAGAVIGQSEFHDWVTAESFNEKLRLLDRRALQLRNLYVDSALDPAATSPVSDALLKALFTKDGVFVPGDLAEAREQLKGQYAAEYASIPDPLRAAAWLDAVLVLELAADLHCKEEMYIYDFVADPKKLAGGGLFAFTGFFDQRYRDHDYDYGRSVAQARIAEYAARPDTVFTGLHWTPGPIRPIDPGLNDLPMSAVDQDKRHRVCKQMVSAADSLMQELGLNAIERLGVTKLFLQKQIEKLLAL
ncbi:MAG: hypothetical protein NVSMB62_12110 [Acidobacteriaceae bacterium]